MSKVVNLPSVGDMQKLKVLVDGKPRTRREIFGGNQNKESDQSLLRSLVESGMILRDDTALTPTYRVEGQRGIRFLNQMVDEKVRSQVESLTRKEAAEVAVTRVLPERLRIAAQEAASTRPVPDPIPTGGAEDFSLSQGDMDAIRLFASGKGRNVRDVFSEIVQIGISYTNPRNSRRQQILTNTVSMGLSESEMKILREHQDLTKKSAEDVIHDSVKLWIQKLQITDEPEPAPEPGEQVQPEQSEKPIESSLVFIMQTLEVLGENLVYIRQRMDMMDTKIDEMKPKRVKKT